ncbi:hypothetical protein, partial [Enterococcus sp. C73]|uniref:hypothetical protein n=1 Tax=Enterococcus sp. C73 TaxID=3231331 RepID=UPI0034A08299
MKKKIILLLFILNLSINQEQIAFAEIANEQNEEQVENNTLKEAERSSTKSVFESGRFKPGIYFKNPYILKIGQEFDPSAPYLGGTAGNGDRIYFSDLTYYWASGKPIDIWKYGDRATMVYKYYDKSGYYWYQDIIVEVEKKDQTKAELKDAEVYVGQKWDLGSVFKNVLDEAGNPVQPQQVEQVYVNGVRTNELDTSRPGKHIVRIEIPDRLGGLIQSNN